MLLPQYCTKRPSCGIGTHVDISEPCFASSAFKKISSDLSQAVSVAMGASVGHAVGIAFGAGAFTASHLARSPRLQPALPLQQSHCLMQMPSPYTP